MTKQSIPRYRVLANQLKHDILSGQLKPGEQLHTELELCEIHNISRHTAREALRLLSEDGLIARRRGAGTVVAEINAPAFAQPIGDFDSILKYARDAHFELDTFGPATPAELAAIGLKGVYSRFDGLRGQASAPPLALTVIYALAQLAPDAPTLRSLDTSISEWIERTHAVAVKKVTQRLPAGSFTKSSWIGPEAKRRAAHRKVFADRAFHHGTSAMFARDALRSSPWL